MSGTAERVGFTLERRYRSFCFLAEEPHERVQAAAHEEHEGDHQGEQYERVAHHLNPGGGWAL